MSQLSLPKSAYTSILFILGLPLLNNTAAAQNVKAEGMITARSGERMIVKTSDNPDLVVQLTDTTDVGQLQGALKARRKEMSMAALIPGLQVKVEGFYNVQHELVAKTVRFKGNDLERAESIQAGMHETKEQVRKNQQELEQHNAELKAQNEALRQHEAKIAANKAAVDAAVARFGQLDDYYIMDEVTVYFANGKVTVDPKYTSQLVALAEKAKSVQGYMIEVKGYASTSGSAAMNQKLSEDRAGSVTNVLIQQAKVPLTRMLAPGAMGESEQIGNEVTKEGEAQNRRVVVRVLQNKAIAGI